MFPAHWLFLLFLYLYFRLSPLNMSVCYEVHNSVVIWHHWRKPIKTEIEMTTSLPSAMAKQKRNRKHKMSMFTGHQTLASRITCLVTYFTWLIGDGLVIWTCNELVIVFITITHIALTLNLFSPRSVWKQLFEASFSLCNTNNSAVIAFFSDNQFTNQSKQSRSLQKKLRPVKASFFFFI